jgi:hypothetical protein
MSPTALEQQAVRGLRDGLQPHAAASKVGDRLLERLAWRQPCSNLVTHTGFSSVSLCVPAMARSRVLSALAPPRAGADVNRYALGLPRCHLSCYTLPHWCIRSVLRYGRRQQPVERLPVHHLVRDEEPGKRL